MKRNEKKQKLVVLRGETTHEHVLEADVLKYDEKATELSEIEVGSDGVLTHVTPSGEKAEHNTIPIEKGTWRMGRQVEFSPFNQSIGAIFD